MTLGIDSPAVFIPDSTYSDSSRFSASIHPTSQKDHTSNPVGKSSSVLNDPSKRETFRVSPSSSRPDKQAGIIQVY